MQKPYSFSRATGSLIGGLFLTCVVFWAGARSVLVGDTITNKPVADTTLYGGNTGNNLGGGSTLIAGATAAGQPNRALIRFDLQSIPTNAVINSVTLTLKVVKTPPSTSPSIFDLHRVLVSWTEGTGTGNQGRPAAAGEATWKARSFPSVLWSTPGAAAPADFAASVSGSKAMNSVGTFVFGSTTGMVADVQAWVTNQAENFGWILISESEHSDDTARRIGSREDAAHTPLLVVDYTVAQPPPQPPTITTQPQSQTVVAGASASFSVTADGSQPLLYQWLFNGGALAGATNPILNLNNVTTNQAGTYAVTVSGPGGTVTSSNAVLTVNPSQATPPTLLTPQVIGNQFEFTFAAEANRSYTVEFTGAFPANWLTLTNLPASATATNLTVIDALGAGPRYYRVRTP